MNAIEVSDVFKTYRIGWKKTPKTALTGISLAVECGETFGFIGPNGAGKSTLIKILVGALRASSGSAKLFGLDVENPDARKGLGFVPENPSLPDLLTPFEILMMGVRLHGLKLGNERKHCLDWLERFDLADVAHSPLRRFSKGMMQRTALAHALAVKPRLLILDEPLSGLDPVGRRDVVDILDDYHKGGGTLFFSSHVLFDVERIADRFGLIHKGKLLTIRSPQEILLDQANIYQLTYSGDTPLEGATLIRPGTHVLEIPASDLPVTLAKVLERGGIVKEIKPKNSLEAVFFKMIENQGGKV